MKSFLFAILFLVMLTPTTAAAEESPTTTTIPVYIFTQQGCPYCAEVMARLDQLKTTYPGLTVYEFDLKVQPKYFVAYQQMAQAYGIIPTGTPVTYIGGRAIEGAKLTSIQEAIEYCSLPVNQCIDPSQYIQGTDKPTANNTSKSKQEIVGWIILGVIIIGGSGLLIYKLR